MTANNTPTPLAPAAPATPNLLTQAEQEGFFADLEAGTISNFGMALRLFETLSQYSAANLPYPSATIHLQGKLPQITIHQGENCGIFVIPVATMAGIDCRRSLQFFGLTLDNAKHVLTEIRNRRPTDRGIENFGLPMVTLQQFFQALPYPQAEVELALTNTHHWTDKLVAHFTSAPNLASLQAIRNSSVIMMEAFMVLLYDALKRPRPQLTGLE